MAGPGKTCKRRLLGDFNICEIEINDNDNEAERIFKRKVSVSSIKKEPCDEVEDAGNAGNQMKECIKMSVENKISEKNAFQLKLIDFLVDALKKHDPNMDNLQVASVSLDASARIYGFRVDKVYIDLLKLLGINSKKRKSIDQGGDDEDEQLDTKSRPARKKRRRYQYETLSTVEALRGKLNTFNPLLFSLNFPVETLTSDMLLMAHLPQHANKEVAVSLFNYVVLDKVQTANREFSNKSSINSVANFTGQPLSPLYSHFRFLGWSPEHDHDYPFTQEYTQIENDSEYNSYGDGDSSSFDDIKDANSTVEDDIVENNIENEFCTIRQSKKKKNSHSEETDGNIYHEFVQPDLDEDDIVMDFMEIIANANPEAAFEYSYTNRSMVRWNGPSHWRLKANKNAKSNNIMTSPQIKVVKKKKNAIVLSFTSNSKEEVEKRFERNRKCTILKNSTKWKDQDLFQTHIIYNPDRLFSYFIKITRNSKEISDKNVNNVDPDSNISHGFHDDSQDHNNDNCFDEDSDDEEFLLSFTHEADESQLSFLSNNLVPIPTFTENTANNGIIPYRRRAKKINMQEIKNEMWKVLTGPVSKNQETQTVNNQNSFVSVENRMFSDVCLDLPNKLSKANALSFNNSIAFVVLMHLAGEHQLIIEQEISLSDLLVRKECNLPLNIKSER